MKTLKLALLTFIIISGFANSSRAAPSTQSRSTINGNWLGVLVIGDAKLRLLLKITAPANGSLTAVMDSLDQPNSNNLQVDVITFQNDVLHFELKALRIVYEGTLSKAGEIVGTFTQAGTERQLIL